MAKRIAKFEKVSFEQFKGDTQMRSEKLPMSRSGKSMIP